MRIMDQLELGKQRNKLSLKLLSQRIGKTQKTLCYTFQKHNQAEVNQLKFQLIRSIALEVGYRFLLIDTNKVNGMSLAVTVESGKIEPEEKMSLGTLLRYKAKIRKISAKNLSEALFLNRERIQRLFSDKATIRMGELVRVAKIFQINIIDLEKLTSEE